MDAILFTHYLPLHEPLTRKHLALIRALNPDAEVIPLKFEEGREDSHWQWRNSDLLLLEWFDSEHPKHDRFFLLEHDVFCTQSLKDFYGPSYDRPVVGSIIIKPWSNEIVPGTRGEPIRMKDWHWFEHSESAELYPFLRGMCPTAGCMFRHDVLFNMVQLWKTNRNLFDPLLSECRLGTLAAMAGYEPQEIRPDCYKFIHSGDVNIEQGAGIFHRVRV